MPLSYHLFVVVFVVKNRRSIAFVVVRLGMLVHHIALMSKTEFQVNNKQPHYDNSIALAVLAMRLGTYSNTGGLCVVVWWGEGGVALGSSRLSFLASMLYIRFSLKTTNSLYVSLRVTGN